MTAYWAIVRWYWKIALPLFFLATISSLYLAAALMSLLLVIAILLSLTSMIVLISGVRKRLPLFRPSEAEPVIYHEDQVSGHSNRSPLLRLTGASRALSVDVTAKAIYVRPLLLLAPAGDIYDLFHRIPLRDILICQRSGNRVRITWTAEQPGDISLLLHDADAFLSAIGRKDSVETLPWMNRLTM